MVCIVKIIFVYIYIIIFYFRKAKKILNWITETSQNQIIILLQAMKTQLKW